MDEFRVGDRVRMTENYLCYEKGRVYTITKDHKDECYFLDGIETYVMSKRFEKEDTMKKVAVHVKNEYLSRAVQEHQFSIGNSWGSSEKERIRTEAFIIGLPGEFSVLSMQTKYTDTGWYKENGYEVISVDEYFKRYDKPLPKPIVIGGSYEVKDIDECGYRFKGQRITWSEHEEIGKRRVR